MTSTKIITALLLLCSAVLQAQEGYQMKPNSQEIEADFLSNYYQQDGNNSPVTGGIGTEQLTDFSTMIVVNVPIDSTRSFNASLGADIYTSASTDNIDNNRSSASSQDSRKYANVGFQKKVLQKGTTYGVKAGFSNEYDYTSFSGGVTFSKEFNEGNSELSVNGQAFFGSWQLIYPIELRGRVEVPSSARRSYNAQLNFAQVLTKRLQLSLSAEAIYMEGLLSTPFHRVYFADQNSPDIERLPNSRLKLPFSARLNYMPTDFLVLRSYYRYYTDDFGITAHTVSLEVPIKLSTTLTLAPYYRYHTQTAADYFAPYQTHTTAEEFYTSDYDLAALTSQKVGLGVKYAPIYGLGRAKLGKKLMTLKYLQLRGTSYTRDTGLNAWSISLDLGIGIK